MRETKTTLLCLVLLLSGCASEQAKKDERINVVDDEMHRRIQLKNQRWIDNGFSHADKNGVKEWSISQDAFSEAQMGNEDVAIEMLGRMHRVNPQDPWPLLFRGILHLRQQHAELARSDFEAAIRCDEFDANVYNDVAWTYACSDYAPIRDGATAVRYAIKACNLSGWREGTYIDTLAAARAETGDFEAAVQMSRKAIALASYKREEIEKHLASFIAGKPLREDVTKSSLLSKKE